MQGLDLGSYNYAQAQNTNYSLYNNQNLATPNMDTAQMFNYGAQNFQGAPNQINPFAQNSYQGDVFQNSQQISAPAFTGAQMAPIEGKEEKKSNKGFLIACGVGILATVGYFCRKPIGKFLGIIKDESVAFKDKNAAIFKTKAPKGEVGTVETQLKNGAKKVQTIDKDGVATSTIYDKAGQARQHLVFKNGVLQEYTLINKNGQQFKSWSQNGEEIINRSKFDKNGRVSEEILYRIKDGKQTKQSFNLEYDTQGRTIKETVKGDAGNVQKVFEHSYKNSGRVKTTIEKDSTGKIIQSIDTQVNNQNNLLKLVKKDADGKLQSEYSFLYKGDGTLNSVIVKDATGAKKELAADSQELAELLNSI